MSTKIPWVRNPDGTPGESWNPTLGCTKNCSYCYMRDLHNRRHEAWKQGRMHNCYRQRFEDPICLPERLERPLHWRKPRAVFVDSAGDLFDPAVPFDFAAAVWGVMAACPQHTFQVLTKRPERMLEWMRWLEKYEPDEVAPWEIVRRPLPNVWLGVTVEDQARADERIPLLLQCEAAVRFVSAEPLLGSVQLPHEFKRLRSRAWIVAGSEGGHGARPMDLDWVRSLRDQCQRAAVPFFYKAGPDETGRRVEMPLLDGRQWAEFPNTARRTP